MNIPNQLKTTSLDNVQPDGSVLVEQVPACETWVIESDTQRLWFTHQRAPLVQGLRQAKTFDQADTPVAIYKVCPRLGWIKWGDPQKKRYRAANWRSLIARASFVEELA